VGISYICCCGLLCCMASSLLPESLLAFLVVPVDAVGPAVASFVEISNIPYIFTMLTFKCEHLQDQNEELYTLKCHQNEGIITRSRSL
jgi:hypothetical protein